MPCLDPRQADRAVAEAVRWLQAGQPVALPTETVYGLAANAFDPAAVRAVFAAKGRPAHNPLIVHVASLEMARACVAEWPETAARLAGRFWPGPLTLVLPRSSRVPDIVTAGGPTVAIRWPAHPVMQAVIRACGFPLAAPSANRSSRLSPTCAAHVLRSLGGRIRLILDAGPCPVGIESTVLDLTARPPRILRPGGVSREAIVACLGTDVLASPPPPAAQPGPQRSPGLLSKHYAPETPVELAAWTDPAGLRRRLDEAG
ncbi:MAG: threonylcarbamoyl-AMP synthase, partial [Verrucomicrobia bacterium]